MSVATGALSYEVLVVDGQPIPGPPAPDGSPSMWSPTTATLICGQERAVLIDGLTTREHAAALLRWIEQRGLELQTVYITHGHGDHFFALAPLMQHYPAASVVAVPEVVVDMKEQTSSPVYDRLWKPLFGDQIHEILVEAQPLTTAHIELEGHDLIIHRAGHSDRSNTTFVWVPDLELVVAGDIVYNGVFPYVVETDQRSRDEWRDALSAIALCNPRTVVAGHKVPGAYDDPRHIHETRRFLDDFDAALDSDATAEEIFESLVVTHHGRLNRTALWAGISTQVRRRDRGGSQFTT